MTWNKCETKTHPEPFESAEILFRNRDNRLYEIGYQERPEFFRIGNRKCHWPQVCILFDYWQIIHTPESKL